MKLMALDVSSKSTGWVVSPKKYGLITPSDKLSLVEKLSFFRDELQKLLVRYKPENVVIEDNYLRFNNVSTLKTLARFQGVAMEICHREGAAVSTITATEARKHCCGKQGKDFKKPEVFRYFKDKYKKDEWVFDDHNDITDAFALYWSHVEKEKLSKKKGNL